MKLIFEYDAQEINNAPFDLKTFVDVMRGRSRTMEIRVDDPKTKKMVIIRITPKTISIEDDDDLVKTWPVLAPREGI